MLNQLPFALSSRHESGFETDGLAATMQSTAEAGDRIVNFVKLDAHVKMRQQKA